MTNNDILILLWNEGATASAIASQIGKTRAAVLAKVKRLRKKGAQLPSRAAPSAKPARKKDVKVNIKKKIKDVKQLSFDYFTVKEEEKDTGVKFQVDLMSLRYDQCHYIVGRVSGTYYYCGEPSSKRSMCAAHYSLCYYMPKD